jgi:hypothetical protein
MTLLPFDVLVDVVAFWRLDTVCRLILGVASWRLVQACAHNRANRWAQRRRSMAGTLVFLNSSLRLVRWLPDPQEYLDEDETLVAEPVYSVTVMPALPIDVPPPAAWITGFQDIDVYWDQCEPALREVGACCLTSSARKIAKIIYIMHYIIRHSIFSAHRALLYIINYLFPVTKMDLGLIFPSKPDQKWLNKSWQIRVTQQRDFGPKSRKIRLFIRSF